MGAILEAYITNLGKYAEGQLVSSRPLQSAQHRPRRISFISPRALKPAWLRGFCFDLMNGFLT